VYPNVAQSSQIGCDRASENEGNLNDLPRLVQSQAVREKNISARPTQSRCVETFADCRVSEQQPRGGNQDFCIEVCVQCGDNRGHAGNRVGRAPGEDALDPIMQVVFVARGARAGDGGRRRVDRGRDARRWRAAASRSLTCATCGSAATRACRFSLVGELPAESPRG
jgi:hypothetical protein